MIIEFYAVLSDVSLKLEKKSPKKHSKKKIRFFVFTEFSPFFCREFRISRGKKKSLSFFLLLPHTEEDPSCQHDVQMEPDERRFHFLLL